MSIQKKPDPQKKIKNVNTVYGYQSKGTIDAASLLGEDAQEYVTKRQHESMALANTVDDLSELLEQTQNQSLAETWVPTSQKADVALGLAATLPGTGDIESLKRTSDPGATVQKISNPIAQHAKTPKTQRRQQKPQAHSLDISTESAQTAGVQSTTAPTHSLKSEAFAETMMGPADPGPSVFSKRELDPQLAHTLSAESAPQLERDLEDALHEYVNTPIISISETEEDLGPSIQAALTRANIEYTNEAPHELSTFSGPQSIERSIKKSNLIISVLALLVIALASLLAYLLR